MQYLEGRRYVVMAVFILVGMLFAGRLFYLQVLDDSYKAAADRNTLQRKVQVPFRGLIYDRHDSVLVQNTPVYDLVVVPREVKNLDSAKFCRVMQMPIEDLRLGLRIAKKYSRVKPSPLLLNLSTPELASIQDYLNDWGERCVAELKLETCTYQQEPVRLIAIIQDFVRQGRLEPPAEEDAAAVRKRAEAILFAALKGKFRSRLLARHLLRQARYFVANRENLRYYRTRGFGMVRKMLLAMGRGFTRNASLREARDVFYLTLPEVEGLVRQPRDLRGTVDSRKEEYALYEQLPLPQRIYTQGAPQLPIVHPAAELVADSGLRELRGLGCSPGVVRGTVRKVHHAAELASVDGGILTTYATDPGYTMLFASAAGILTERGSLLSHAAIVSREMGLPCVVAVEGLMAQLQDGDTVLLDGSTGLVKIIQRA